MFDQTFVEGTETKTKPLTLVVSILMQLAAVCVVIAVPLIYTATLPSAAFKSFLVAPPPPLAAIARTVHRAPAGRTIHVQPFREIALNVPKPLRPLENVGAPPEVAVSGNAGQPGSLLDGLPMGVPGSAPEPPAPAQTPAAAKPKPAGPIKISTGAAEARLISRVMPAYPALAKETRIQGIVEFRATISKQGNIENLQLVRGHPLLVNAAREAVLQWKYRPTLLNGLPVEVLTDIVVNFTLVQ
jgi:periplasmic protein TonB